MRSVSWSRKLRITVHSNARRYYGQAPTQRNAVPIASDPSCPQFLLLTALQVRQRLWAALSAQITQHLQPKSSDGEPLRFGTQCLSGEHIAGASAWSKLAMSASRSELRGAFGGQVTGASTAVRQ